MSGRRVLVVGAGFAGLHAAMELRALASSGHRVTVVNPQNFMQYQPFLPEVASGTIDPRAVVVPLRPLLRGCEVLVGEVVSLDHDARTASVRLSDGEERSVGYDEVVLAAGSRSRVLPIPGLAEHGVGFKTIQEAIFLRNRVLSRLDVATETSDPEVRRAALTFVFVGGGYAGVEALGELEDLARDASSSYPGLGPDEMRWVLVEAAEEILPELGPELARYARGQLARRGIDIVLRTQLASAEGGVIRLSDGQTFRADTLVWTAGVTPESIAGSTGLPLDEHGRVRTDEYLRVLGVEGAWAAGDIAAVPDRATGAICPPTAQHGLRQGRRLGRNLVASIQGRPLEPFDYRAIGGVASLGRYEGIALVRGVRFRGFLGWFLHRSYHLLAMPTLGRRVRVAMDWTVALLFPRDLAQLGVLEHPRAPFEQAAGE